MAVKTQEVAIVFSSRTREFNRSIKKVKTTIKNVGAYLGGLAVAGGIFSVQKAMEQTKAIGKMQIQYEKAGYTMQETMKDVQAESERTGKSFTDLTEVGFALGSKFGSSWKDNLPILKAINDLATAQYAEVTTTGKAVAKYMDAFGLKGADAKTAVEELNLAVNQADADMTSFADAVPIFASIAAETDMSREQVLALSAQMSQSYGNTQLMATAMKNLLTQMVSNDAIPKTVDGLKNLWIQYKGNAEGLKKLLGGNEAYIALLNAVGKPMTAYNSTMEEMNNKTALFTQQLNSGLANPAAQMARLSETVNNLGANVGIGLLPPLMAVTAQLREFLSNKDNLESLQYIVQGIGQFAVLTTKAFTAWVSYGRVVLGIYEKIFNTIVNFYRMIGSKIGIDTVTDSNRTKLQSSASGDVQAMAYRNLQTSSQKFKDSSGRDRESMLLDEMKRLNGMFADRIPQMSTP